jgi:hypothetical protein
MSNARIVTAALASAAVSASRNAVQWRNDFLIARAQGAGHDMAATTQNKKSPKPRFEYHEREVGHREFVARLYERSNNGKLTEIEVIRIGMFGKLIADETVRPEAPAAS